MIALAWIVWSEAERGVSHVTYITESSLEIGSKVEEHRTNLQCLQLVTEMWRLQVYGSKRLMMLE